jgi:hypothetical protein
MIAALFPGALGAEISCCSRSDPQWGQAAVPSDRTGNSNVRPHSSQVYSYRGIGIPREIMNTTIKFTQDGRKVEVIGTAICLDGHYEADKLVAVIAHPAWRAILQAAPDATHMAGRVALSVDEAQMAQLALNAARETVDASPLGAAERSRLAVNRMLMNRADE